MYYRDIGFLQQIRLQRIYNKVARKQHSESQRKPKEVPRHLGTEHFNAILIEIISGYKGSDIISDYQSKREQIITHSNTDIRLHTILGSEAVADIQTHSPPLRLLPYCVGDSYYLMSWIDADAIQSRIVTAYPCSIGAVGISLLCDGYLHFHAIYAVCLHCCVSLGRQKPCLVPHYNTILWDWMQIGYGVDDCYPCCVACLDLSAMGRFANEQHYIEQYRNDKQTDEPVCCYNFLIHSSL